MDVILDAVRVWTETNQDTLVDDKNSLLLGVAAIFEKAIVKASYTSALRACPELVELFPEIVCLSRTCTHDDHTGWTVRARIGLTQSCTLFISASVMNFDVVLEQNDFADTFVICKNTRWDLKAAQRGCELFLWSRCPPAEKHFVTIVEKVTV